MRYQGSLAYQEVEVAEPRRAPRREAEPSFEVVSGGGLDARARRGVSPQLVQRLRAVIAVAAVLLVLGVARVALTSATVAILEENGDLSTEIAETQSANADLKIARSVLSSNSRISRIATQNLGMVLPSERVTVTVDAPAADASATDGAAASSDAGASDATADAAATSQPDGEAAQTGADAAQESPVA